MVFEGLIVGIKPNGLVRMLWTEKWVLHRSFQVFSISLNREHHLFRHGSGSDKL